MNNIFNKIWEFLKFVWNKPLWSYCFTDHRGWKIAWRSFVCGVLFMCWIMRTAKIV